VSPPPTDPARDDAQDRTTDALAQRIATLEAESVTHRDHRTRVQTLLGLAGAAALVVILGAVSVRDTTLATSAQVATLAARVAADEAAVAARDADERSTRDTIVRLTTVVDALRVQVADLTSELRARETAAPTRPAGR
jgi:cell division protein FtsL